MRSCGAPEYLYEQLADGFLQAKNGAEDEIRTRDLLLGKEMLYH